MKSGDNWTAVVLAGERPGENGFAHANGVAAKALIPVAGEAMLSRVVRALLAVDAVARVVVLAQAPEMLLDAVPWLRAEPRVGTATSGDGISASVAAVAGGAAAPWPVLIVTADHALIEPATIAWFLDAARGDVAAGVVERRVIEDAYPETRRTWLKFGDGDYSGANLFALRGPRAAGALALWGRVERDRKKALRLLSHFGPLLALRALTRTISLDAALRTVGGKAGLDAMAVRLPFAEAAIDVDKPEDLLLAERILQQRS